MALLMAPFAMETLLTRHHSTITTPPAGETCFIINVPDATDPSRIGFNFFAQPLVGDNLFITLVSNQSDAFGSVFYLVNGSTTLNFNTSSRNTPSMANVAPSGSERPADPIFLDTAAGAPDDSLFLSCEILPDDDLFCAAGDLKTGVRTKFEYCPDFVGLVETISTADGCFELFPKVMRQACSGVTTTSIITESITTTT